MNKASDLLFSLKAISDRKKYFRDYFPDLLALAPRIPSDWPAQLLDAQIADWELSAVQPNLARLDEPKIVGKIKVRLESGGEKEIAIRADSPVVSVDFESTLSSAPWDYEDPDEDGVFI